MGGWTHMYCSLAAYVKAEHDPGGGGTFLVTQSVCVRTAAIFTGRGDSPHCAVGGRGNKEEAVVYHIERQEALQVWQDMYYKNRSLCLATVLLHCAMSDVAHCIT